MAVHVPLVISGPTAQPIGSKGRTVSTPAVEEILGQLPIEQLAAQFGVDPQTVTQAAAAAIPSLIGGLQHNADQGGEQAVAGALAQHGSSNLLDSGSVDLNSVDTADGAKIVQHIFGDQSTQLAHAIGQRTGASGSLVNQLLPILAPIVLAYLAKKLTGSQPAGSGGGILGNILGSVLGGQSGTQTSSGGGMLGSILGGILSGGGIGSVLGGAEASQAPSSPVPDQPSSEPQSSGGVFTTTPVSDAGSLSVDETPDATVDEPQQAPTPQTSSSIVDEILGGLFGKR
jgi:hypothetical protein